MSSSPPPRAANALLARLGPRNEALAGDLLEEWRAGRTRGWYWRQVLTAIVVGAYGDLREHKVLVARAVVTGWASFVFFHVLGRDYIDHTLGDWILDQLILARWEQIASGADSFVILYATRLQFLPAGCLGFFFSGWVVGRLHRSCPAAALFVFSATVIALSAYYSDLVRLVGGPVAVPSPVRTAVFMRSLFFGWSGYAIVPILILMGGISSALPKPRALGSLPIKH